MVHIGLSAYDMAAADFVELARAADELGFESLWLGEHIVLPLDYGSAHPTARGKAPQRHKAIIDPSTTLIDPLVALAGAAAVTTDIRLATGIYILPLRPPLVTARMTCTLDDLSGGRFLLGAGSGWLEEEFDAIGVPFAERGPRFDEAIDILRLAWSGEPFRFEGCHFRNELVQVSPRPVDVPLFLGGNTDRALRRAAEKADGWFASGTPAFDDAMRWRDRLLELRHQHGRTGDFSIYVRIPKPDRGDIDRYAAEGLDRVLIWADQVWSGDDLDAKRASLAAAAQDLRVLPTRPSRDAMSGGRP